MHVSRNVAPRWVPQLWRLAKQYATLIVRDHVDYVDVAQNTLWQKKKVEMDRRLQTQRKTAVALFAGTPLPLCELFGHRKQTKKFFHAT